MTVVQQIDAVVVFPVHDVAPCQQPRYRRRKDVKPVPQLPCLGGKTREREETEGKQEREEMEGNRRETTEGNRGKQKRETERNGGKQKRETERNRREKQKRETERNRREKQS